MMQKQPMGLPVRRQATNYKKPSHFNVVSGTIALFMLASVFFLYCTWPVLALRLRVKGELDDAMNRFWRANLRGAQSERGEMVALQNDLRAKLVGVGVTDKNLEVVFVPGKVRIALEARFTSSVVFPVIDKTYVFHLAPRAETDSARVDW
jgi:hypothetical protein